MNIKLSGIITSLLIPATVLILSSCNKYTFVDCETYDYNDCVTYASEFGTMDVMIDLPPGQSKVSIVVFEGNFPSKDTVFTDTLSGSTSYTLEMGRTYSVTAEYFVDGERIIAVDGDEITQKSYDVCDSVCWISKDAEIDLRLKFDK